MRPFLNFFIVVLGLLCPMQAAHALESPWQSDSNLQARLVSGVDATGKKADFPAALELRLDEGWHIYWRSPGDEGVAPKLDWSASSNIASTSLFWPMPQRFTLFDMQSFGYAGSVLFPITVTPQSAGDAVTLAVKGDIMICKDMCVPQAISLSLTIPKGAAKDSASGPLIANAFSKLADANDNRQLTIKSVVLGPDALVVQIYAQKGIDKTDLFVEVPGIKITGKPEATPDPKDPHMGLLRIAKPSGMTNLGKALENHKVTLTLTDGARAIEKEYSF